jgi:DNA polymerase III delta prime subunit
LICNYISKIDEGLQNEFMRLRFNQLPKNMIIQFLTNISEHEKLNLNKESIIYFNKAISIKPDEAVFHNIKGSIGIE